MHPISAMAKLARSWDHSLPPDPKRGSMAGAPHAATKPSSFADARRLPIRGIASESDSSHVSGSGDTDSSGRLAGLGGLRQLPRRDYKNIHDHHSNVDREESGISLDGIRTPLDHRLQSPSPKVALHASPAGGTKPRTAPATRRRLQTDAPQLVALATPVLAASAELSVDARTRDSVSLLSYSSVASALRWSDVTVVDLRFCSWERHVQLKRRIAKTRDRLQGSETQFGGAVRGSGA